jgi:hypothetical protein
MSAATSFAGPCAQQRRTVQPYAWSAAVVSMSLSVPWPSAGARRADQRS